MGSKLGTGVATAFKSKHILRNIMRVFISFIREQLMLIFSLGIDHCI